MKYYIPRLQLGVLSEVQQEAENKFGGLPWGLPPSQWPICRCCGKSMSMVAQLFHDDLRLNLGRTGRCLFVFQCALDCDGTWDSSMGTNYSFVVEPEVLEKGITYPPDIADPESAEIRCDQNSAYNQTWVEGRTIWVHAEARVLSWVEQDDGIHYSEFSKFLDGKKYWDISDELIGQVYSGTKFGSVPDWLQSPQLPELNFVAQISEGYSFYTNLPTPDEVGCPVGRGNVRNYQRTEPKVTRYLSPREIYENEDRANDDDPIWLCSAFNFGDAGKGYLFIGPVEDGGLPKAEFIWQCH